MYFLSDNLYSVRVNQDKQHLVPGNILSFLKIFVVFLQLFPGLSLFCPKIIWLCKSLKNVHISKIKLLRVDGREEVLDYHPCITPLSSLPASGDAGHHHQLGHHHRLSHQLYPLSLAVLRIRSTEQSRAPMSLQQISALSTAGRGRKQRGCGCMEANKLPFIMEFC